jgi:hypothetical protein
MIAIREDEKTTPKSRKHLSSGRAVVNLSGLDCYLGVYGSEKSKQNYRLLIAAYLAPDGLRPVAHRRIRAIVRIFKWAVAKPLVCRAKTQSRLSF